MNGLIKRVISGRLLHSGCCSFAVFLSVLCALCVLDEVRINI